MKHLALYLCIAVVAVMLFSSCNGSKDKHAEQGAKAEQIDKAKGTVMNITGQDFKRKIMDYDAGNPNWVYKGTKAAVVDFTASWCGPCKTMKPIINDMAEKYAGKVDFYQVDVDKEQELVSVFGINTVPAFLFIPADGETPTLLVGAMVAADFEAQVRSLM